jgi:hypothetical protein
MAGVDLSDQFNSYNSGLRKTTKWYKKLFFHLLNVCLINAYLLHKKLAPNEKKVGSPTISYSSCQSIGIRSTQYFI